MREVEGAACQAAGGKAVEAIIEWGNRIQEAKAAYKLQPQRWGQRWDAWCKEALGNSQPHLARITEISRNLILSKNDISKLPTQTDSLYTPAQLAKIPRDWVTYVDLVRQFRIEGEPISETTYKNLVRSGALIDAINLRNSQGEGPVLPLPESPSHCEPFAGLLKREAVGGAERPRDLSGFAPVFRRQIENNWVNTNPYLPAVDQVDVVNAWADCWDALPSDRQYDNLNRPVPPSRNWSRRWCAGAAHKQLITP